MTFVWVVMQGEYGQGGSIIAIAASREAARRIVADKIAEENCYAHAYRDESREYIIESEAGCGYEFDSAEWDAEYSKRMYWRMSVEPGRSQPKGRPNLGGCGDSLYWEKGGDWLKIETRLVQD
mgnify:FL=1